MMKDNHYPDWQRKCLGLGCKFKRLLLGKYPIGQKYIRKFTTYVCNIWFPFLTCRMYYVNMNLATGTISIYILLGFFYKVGLNWIAILMLEQVACVIKPLSKYIIR